MLQRRVKMTKVEEQTLRLDDGKTTATHEKSELVETHMPSKGHSYLDLVSRSDDGFADQVSHPQPVEAARNGTLGKGLNRPPDQTYIEHGV